MSMKICIITKSVLMKSSIFVVLVKEQTPYKGPIDRPGADRDDSECLELEPNIRSARTPKLPAESRNRLFF